MQYADYDFYKTEYKGSAIPEAEFDTLAMRAGAFLDKLKSVFTVTEVCAGGFKNACCACADIIWDDARRSDIKTQSVGSVSFTRTDHEKVETELYKTAQVYLHIYRGV